MYVITRIGLPTRYEDLHIFALDACTSAEVNNYEYTVIRDGVDITDQMKREALSVIASVRNNRKGA
jgi:hypothetical protein